MESICCENSDGADGAGSGTGGAGGEAGVGGGGNFIAANSFLTVSFLWFLI